MSVQLWKFLCHIYIFTPLSHPSISFSFFSPSFFSSFLSGPFLLTLLSLRVSPPALSRLLLSSLYPSFSCPPLALALSQWVSVAFLSLPLSLPLSHLPLLSLSLSRSLSAYYICQNCSCEKLRFLWTSTAVIFIHLFHLFSPLHHSFVLRHKVCACVQEISERNRCSTPSSISSFMRPSCFLSLPLIQIPSGSILSFLSSSNTGLASTCLSIDWDMCSEKKGCEYSLDGTSFPLKYAVMCILAHEHLLWQ